MSQSDSTAGTLKFNRRAIRKKNLHDLILTLLTASQIGKLRARYAEGRENIAELSRISNCPPVLLYSILTPLWSKTPIKLRMLRLEKSVVLLRNRGMSEKKIAMELDIPIAVVREHGSHRFSERIAAQRPWYQLRAPKPKDPNVYEYDESTLPPTTRLGWQDGTLLDIPAAIKGRCPSCRCIVSLPCLACRVREDREKGLIPPISVDDEREEEEWLEPDLLFQ